LGSLSTACRAAPQDGFSWRQGQPSREIRDLKRQLQDLAADVLDGKVERGNAVVVNQILNTRLRAIELERKIREQDELEERLATLEQAQEQKGDRRWGA
jgi:predicted ArsR family transcriptional regulator